MKFFVLLIIFVINSANAEECANEAEACGGQAGKPCCATQDRLRCQQPAGNTDPKAVGTCVKSCKQEGEMCGGFAGFVCCSGQNLKCNAPNKCCDMAGTCVKST